MPGKMNNKAAKTMKPYTKPAAAGRATRNSKKQEVEPPKKPKSASDRLADAQAEEVNDDAAQVDDDALINEYLAAIEDLEEKKKKYLKLKKKLDHPDDQTSISNIKKIYDNIDGSLLEFQLALRDIVPPTLVEGEKGFRGIASGEISSGEYSYSQSPIPSFRRRGAGCVLAHSLIPLRTCSP